MTSQVAEPHWFMEAYRRSQVAMVIIDAAGGLIGANPTAQRLLGDGRSLAPQITAELVATAAAGAPLIELDERHYRLHRQRYRRPDGRLFDVIELIDVTPERRREQDLLERLDRDCLTGLKSRDGFMREAALLTAERRRGVRPLAVAMLDLDDFKAVNDKAGHAAGDALLALVAERCRSSLREGDVIGRLGGDEFAAILPGADLAAAGIVAERVRQAVRACSGTPEAGGQRVSLSIGIALGRPDDDGIGPALERADRALYAAKSAGGDRVRLHAG